MHQDHGHRTQAMSIGLLQAGLDVGQFQGLEFAPGRIDAAGYLDHSCVESVGQPDIECEDIGAVLVADLQDVPKAAVGYQNGGFALALEQRVGADGRTHLDCRHPGRALRTAREDLGDPVKGRVRITLGILGQQLARLKHPVGPARHDVGERPAAVDPELPATLHGRHRGGRGRLITPRSFGKLTLKTGCVLIVFLRF